MSKAEEQIDLDPEYARLILGILANGSCPPQCAKFAREINQFARRNSVGINFNRGKGKPPLSISASEMLPVQEEKQEFKVITTVYGEVIDVGGTSPNVHLRYQGRELICDVAVELAKALGKRLYTVVGLEGEARVVDMQIERFAATKILPFKHLPGQDILKALRDLEKENGHFNNISATQFVKSLRGDDEQD